MNKYEAGTVGNWIAKIELDSNTNVTMNTNTDRANCTTIYELKKDQKQCEEIIKKVRIYSDGRTSRHNGMGYVQINIDTY